MCTCNQAYLFIFWPIASITCLTICLWTNIGQFISQQLKVKIYTFTYKTFKTVQNNFLFKLSIPYNEINHKYRLSLDTIVVIKLFFPRINWYFGSRPVSELNTHHTEKFFVSCNRTRTEYADVWPRGMVGKIRNLMFLSWRETSS